MADLDGGESVNAYSIINLHKLLRFSVMPILLRTTHICLILFRISRNGPDEAYGRNARSREMSNGFSRNLQLLVSLCEHGAV